MNEENQSEETKTERVSLRLTSEIVRKVDEAKSSARVRMSRNQIIEMMLAYVTEKPDRLNQMLRSAFPSPAGN